MDVFEEETGGRTEIPGLPDSERGNKKGKKKGNNKKTLSLQNFLQDENQEPSNNDPPDSGLDAHFQKLNLDSEELIVMESCHSYIHDFLRQLGPTHAMDPILQQEINNFPPEAKRIIQKCGGYRNFILRSKDLAVVDKIVAAKSDLRNAQEMAFKEIYNNLPTSSSQPLGSKNENISGDNSANQTKEIWNRKSNINQPSANIWDPRGNEKAQDHLQLEMPRVDSLFNEQKGNNSLYYQSNPASSSNLNQDQEFSKTESGILHQHNYSAQQNLLKGLGQQDNYHGNDTKHTGASFPAGNQMEDMKERLWRLQEQNQELQHRLTDRDQLHEELRNLQAKYANLESIQHNTKNDFMMAKAELEQVKSELARVKADKSNFSLHDDGSGGNRQDLIFSLKKNLEALQLKNQELEKQKAESSRFFTPASLTGPWSSSLPTSGLASTDTDLLGIRSMLPGPWSEDAVTSQAGPAPSLLPPSVSQGASSFLSGGHRGNDMFGGLTLGTPHEYKPILSRSSTNTSLGLHLLDTSPQLVTSSHQPTQHLASTQVVMEPRATKSPSEQYSAPQQLTVTKAAPVTPAPAVTSTAPAAPVAKTARQEMLVKKLVTMLPEGTTEDTIKNCIQVLRAKNGKLSGWPTSKIASSITELLQAGHA